MSDPDDVEKVARLLMFMLGSQVARAVTETLELLSRVEPARRDAVLHRLKELMQAPAYDMIRGK